MEPLWSPVVATDGKQCQIGSARKPENKAKPLEVDGREDPAREALRGPSAPVDGVRFLVLPHEAQHITGAGAGPVVDHVNRPVATDGESGGMVQRARDGRPHALP